MFGAKRAEVNSRIAGIAQHMRVLGLTVNEEEDAANVGEGDDGVIFSVPKKREWQF